MDNESQSSDLVHKLVCAGCVGQDLNEKANEYRRKKQWDEALEMANLSLKLCMSGEAVRALEIANPNQGFSLDEEHLRSMGIASIHIGAIYHAQGDLEEALKHYKLSLASFIYDRRNRSVSYLALARVQLKLDDWKAAIEAYEYCLEILRGFDQDLYTEIHQEYQEVMASVLPLPLVSPVKEGGKKIPIVARISAGPLSQAVEDYEDIPVRISEKYSTHVDFALRVDGDSMVEDMIQTDDLILVQRRNDLPPNKRIVAVMVSETEDKATLKRFYMDQIAMRDNKGISYRETFRLEPANANLPLIILCPQDLPEAVIRRHYNGTHPDRELEIHSEMKPQISGWARALIRKQDL